MEIKFKKKLTDYKYIAMFDLASKQSGFCLFDIVNRKPVYTKTIVVSHEDGKPFTINLEKEINDLYDYVSTQFKTYRNDILFVCEAMPTQVSSRASTIQTFLALAKSHAIFDHFLYKYDFHQYDCVGVYPATTHSYYKLITGCDKSYKVDKKDIKKYVIDTFGLKNDISFDESDAVFLALTFVERKWNNDLDEKIRELKRHKKELKMNSAIQSVDDEIAKLLSYKI